MKTKESKINRLEKNNTENKIKYIFYKLSSSGISLIVLVITIIVIIILATAIILTFNKNNPITEANRARYESDRDNIQGIFTNTVAKVMSKNQSSINIKEGQINNVVEGVNETIGEVIYELENPEKGENKNGKIIFDNSENTEVEYYTGRKLPIYSSGKTIWSVDSQGVINLKVGKNDTSEDTGNSENNSSNTGSSGITKEEYNNIINEISEMKKTIQNQNDTIENQNTKINKLENETILNKRELLSNRAYDIPLSTDWVEGNLANITLNNSIKNYKYLEINIEILNGSDAFYENTEFLAVDNLKYNNTNIVNWGDGSVFPINGKYGYYFYYVVGWFKNDKTLFIGCASTDDNRHTYSLRIKSIYGIK